MRKVEEPYWDKYQMKVLHLCTRICHKDRSHTICISKVCSAFKHVPVGRMFYISNLLQVTLPFASKLLSGTKVTHLNLPLADCVITSV